MWVSLNSMQAKWNLMKRHFVADAAAVVKPATPASSSTGAADSESKAYVDTDAKKLVAHACMNYMKGGADVKLGEDKDYPDWLWTLETGHKRLKEARRQEARREYAIRNSWYLQKNTVGTIYPKDQQAYGKDRFNNRHVMKARRAWASETGAARQFPDY
ncbi:unnamed protein product [Sphagnum balticum]